MPCNRYLALCALQVPPHVRRQQLAYDGVHIEVGLQALRGKGVMAQERLRALPGTGRADLPAGAVHSRLDASAAVPAQHPLALSSASRDAISTLL